MASPVSRQFFLRAALRSSRANNLQGLRASRRTMSSTAEQAKKGSDMPWIIGSALVFGPAFLYMVSPASRKSAPHVSHRDDKGHDEHSPMPMKDDEGKEADVAETVQKAESDDVPKADSADKSEEKEEKTQGPVTPPEEAKKDPEPAPKNPAGSKEEGGPTETGEVRGEAAHPNPESPKSVDEKTDKKKSEDSS